MDEELLFVLVIIGGAFFVLRQQAGAAAVSYRSYPSLFGRGNQQNIQVPGVGSYSSGPFGTTVTLAQGLFNWLKPSPPAPAPAPHALTDTIGNTAGAGASDPAQVSDPMSPFYDPTSPYYNPALDVSNYPTPASGDQLGGVASQVSFDPLLGGGDPNLSVIGDPSSGMDFPPPTGDALALPIADAVLG